MSVPFFQLNIVVGFFHQLNKVGSNKVQLIALFISILEEYLCMVAYCVIGTLLCTQMLWMTIVLNCSANE
jgi:hypothetical protein